MRLGGGRGWGTLGRRFFQGTMRGILPVARFLSEAPTQDSKKPVMLDEVDLEAYESHRIRNFCIVAHIDHGKTSLSNRIMEKAGILDASSGEELVLDSLQVEKERGITVKAQTVSMDWKGTLLNLIDTPGHVDFSSEVVRAVKACESAILLVDAIQGMQAQTFHNLFLALEQDPPLAVLPVINKIDLALSLGEKGMEKLAATERELQQILTSSTQSVLHISAKADLGVDDLLDAIVSNLPPPPDNRDKPLWALLFDSWYDDFRGVCCLFKVVDGSISVGDVIKSCHNGSDWTVQEIGVIGLNNIVDPSLPRSIEQESLIQKRSALSKRKAKRLWSGQVGYAFIGCRELRKLLPGDTFFRPSDFDLKSLPSPPSSSSSSSPPSLPVTPLPGMKPFNPMVHAGIYPVDAEQLPLFIDAVEKLLLTDRGVVAVRDRRSLFSSSLCSS